jgi:hypothetical protein
MNKQLSPLLALADRIEEANECPMVISIRAAAELRHLHEVNAELLAALEAASEHLDYVGYGDSWERECAHDARLPEQISEAITKATGKTK